jgi:hypothetical protein
MIKIFDKKPTEEEMRKAQMFSITKYLDACYINGKEPSPEVMQHVDFSEVGSKHIISYHPEHGQFNDYIEESLTENCIRHLPFEAYEKFITIDWLGFTKRSENRSEDSIVRKALSRKNISLLERLHDLGIQKALADKDFTHTYTRDYIQKLYLFPLSLNTKYTTAPHSQDFNERFLKLIRKCVCEHDYFGKIAFVKHKNAKLVYKKNPNWIKDCAWFSQSYSEGIEKSLNNALKALASSDKFILLLEDGLIQTAKNYPKDIRYILGLESKTKTDIKGNESTDLLDSVLSTAFKASNFIGAKTIVENFGLSEKECFDAYVKNIKEDIYNLTYKYDDEAPLNTLLTNNFTSFYQNAKRDFFPNLENDYLPLFILGKDEVLKNQLLKDKEKIINITIPFGKNSFSLYDSILLAKAVDTISQHLAKEGKSLEFSFLKDDCSNMELKDIVAKHIYYSEKSLLSEVDYNTIPEKAWAKLFEKESISYFLKLENGKKTSSIEFNDLKVLWEAAMLNIVLSNDNPEKNKKLKI